MHVCVAIPLFLFIFTHCIKSRHLIFDQTNHTACMIVHFRFKCIMYSIPNRLQQAILGIVKGESESQCENAQTLYAQLI